MQNSPDNSRQPVSLNGLTFTPHQEPKSWKETFYPQLQSFIQKAGFWGVDRVASAVGLDKLFDIPNEMKKDWQLKQLGHRVESVEEFAGKLDATVQLIIQEHFAVAMQRVEAAASRIEQGRSIVAVGQMLDHVATTFPAWSHGFYQGSLKGTPHWDQISRNPRNYGEILAAGAKGDPKQAQIAIELEGKLAFLQMPMQRLQHLLSDKPLLGSNETVLVKMASDREKFFIEAERTPYQNIASQNILPFKEQQTLIVPSHRQKGLAEGILATYELRGEDFAVRDSSGKIESLFLIFDKLVIPAQVSDRAAMLALEDYFREKFPSAKHRLFYDFDKLVTLPTVLARDISKERVINLSQSIPSYRDDLKSHIMALAKFGLTMPDPEEVALAFGASVCLSYPAGPTDHRRRTTVPGAFVWYEYDAGCVRYATGFAEGMDKTKGFYLRAAGVMKEPKSRK